jgi:hypothetical protein
MLNGTGARMNGRPAHVSVGPHRISVAVSGAGGPAVVIEPAFGGSAQSWQAVARALSEETTVATYDRADEVAGMVLVDSSHEAQEDVLRGCLPWRIRFLEAVTVPLLMIVPQGVRGGADRRSIVREFRSVKRLTAADQPLAEGMLGDRPLIVLTRGPGRGGAIAEDWRRWHGLHEDLARLSANSRHVVTGQPGHYIHKSEPGLVSGAILEVVRSVRAGSPLGDPAA